MCREAAWAELTAGVTFVSAVQSKVRGFYNEYMRPEKKQRGSGGVFSGLFRFYFTLAPIFPLRYNYKMGIIEPLTGYVRSYRNAP